MHILSTALPCLLNAPQERFRVRLIAKPNALQLRRRREVGHEMSHVLNAPQRLQESNRIEIEEWRQKA